MAMSISSGRRRLPIAAAVWAVALGLALPATWGAAAVELALQPATQTVPPGTEFELSLEIPQSGSAFNAFDAIVKHDPSALTLVELSPLSLQEGTMMKSACGTRFHRFRRGADRDTITDVLLCSGVSVTGPGQVYRLRFLASNTPQTTSVQFLPGTRFYEAGIEVAPVSTYGATIAIGTPVGVEPGSRGSAPLGISASPNPSRSIVVFHVVTRTAGRQEVIVADVLGREMCRLAAGWFDAGPRELAWDGRDEAGAQVPAGVYFAELRTREGTVRVPLVRLR